MEFCFKFNLDTDSKFYNVFNSFTILTVVFLLRTISTMVKTQLNLKLAQSAQPVMGKGDCWPQFNRQVGWPEFSVGGLV